MKSHQKPKTTNPLSPQIPLYPERSHHIRSHSQSHHPPPFNPHSHRRTVSASVSLDTTLDTPMWQSPSSSPQHRYHCSQCPKTFTRPSSLRIHVFSHTGEKPHLCPHNGCGRRFSVQSNMRRHLRVHYCPSKPESTNFQKPFEIQPPQPPSSTSLW
ncbi:hypothetical protein CLU79DRAFT_750103 [Phycomyces nitens]|nr:hypothetical protein CLU79DRAFT_750103 [Phycomyces nitens]